MKKYAVLVGNSQFPDEKDKDQLPDLACPENDVDGLAQVLASENAEFEIIALKNKSAKEILKNFQFTVDKLQSDDLLLFYYSGHGIRSEKTEQLYLSTFDTEIAALEASAIYIDRIYNILNNNLRCTRKIILLDCCFSGAAAQGFRGVVDPWQQLNHNARGTYLVTSSTRNQVSKENAEEGYGLFTKYLIYGIKTGEADKNNTGWINMDDWFDYVQSRVVAENPKQLPTMRLGNDGVQGGKLVIAKSGRDAKKEQLIEIKTYFSTLFAHHQIGQDTFIEMTQLLDKTYFSNSERQQYDLIVEVFESKKLAGFERKWGRLLLEIEKEQEKLAEDKAARENKLAEEKAAKEKAEQESFAREKEAQEIREREYLEEEKGVKDLKKDFKYAILVGNSQFPEERELPYLVSSENDVDGLEEVLASENAGFEVITLKNKAHYEIERVLQNTVKQLKADDMLLFYYSGLGMLNNNGELYLTTLNTEINCLESSAIGMNQLYTILTSYRRNKAVITILDCCFSGAAGSGAARNDFNRAAGSRNFYLLTGCTKNQVSTEKDGHGLFTKHLIYGLKTGQADTDCDGWIEIGEWFKYACNHVIEENPKQQPFMFTHNAVGQLLIAKIPIN